MALVISPARFSALKRQAKRVSRATPRLTHAQALDQVARDTGFLNWSRLAQAVNLRLPTKDVWKGSNASSSKSHCITLFGQVFHTDVSRRKYWQEEVATSHPKERYRGCRRLPIDLTFRGRDEDGVKKEIATAKRTIAFMDSADLRPSRAWVSLFKQLTIPTGFDHTIVWRTADSSYVVTTEPYPNTGNLPLITEWCNTMGWKFMILPRHLGLWNPCRVDCPADCKAHTHTVIMTPSKRGSDISAVVRAWGQINGATA